MEKKLFLSLIGVIVIFAVVAVIAATLQTGTLGIQDNRTGTRIDVPNVNIKDVVNVVSTEKPAIAVAKFAEAETAGEKTGTELTIYNQEFALAKEKRQITLKKGVNEVKYKDVAEQIDATSVMFRDLSDPSTIVLEQNYQYDLVNKTKILEKYLEKEITLQSTTGTETKTYTGILLSYSDGITLQTSNGIVSINNIDSISFPTLPEGLLTKPTLLWKIYTEKEGSRQIETTYLTNGLGWRADYIAKVNPNDTAMDFTGWVTTTNNSGTSYPDTKLKLVAGDVHRVVAPQRYGDYYNQEKAASPAATGGFVEEGLFEYHMYTLQRTTDIANNETKQISLLAAEGVPVTKELVYDGSYNGTKVQIKLNFKNSENQGLGIPLPKGLVRVYKEDSSGQLQFVGEDQIDHTAKDEKVRLYLGDAFDVVGERKQTESVNLSKGYYRDSYEITLRNHKDAEQAVTVVEHVYDSAKVTQKSDAFEKKDAYTLEFKVKVPANGEKVITYTVEYQYYW